MNNQLTIPKTIKVGFQNRSDTYTGKLAYVIYIDSKGVLRKEASWESWRDKKIEPQEFKNEPTDGFVLNRGVGGARQSYGWNARNEYIRVYDKRCFEFEISVANLLFILQECSAIKGKGLEGEFVYAWNGTELVLLPFDCPEYKQSVEHCELQLKKISAKDVEAGCTYLTKDKEEVMYLGRHTWFDEKSIRSYNWNKAIIGKKEHVFVYLDDKKKGRQRYWLQGGFTKLAARTSDKPIPSYADEFEKLIKSRYVSEPVRLTLEDSKIKLGTGEHYWYWNSICIFLNDKYYIGNVREWYDRNSSYWDREKQKEQKYEITCEKFAEIKNGEYRESLCAPRDQPYDTRIKYGFYKEGLTVTEVKALVKDLYIECENGAKYKVGGET